MSGQAVLKQVDIDQPTMYIGGEFNRMQARLHFRQFRRKRSHQSRDFLRRGRDIFRADNERLFDPDIPR